MLRELSIKNFAIIDDLRIQFGKGLTILTGETGAGKSIIVDAVNLLLGGRASADFIRTGVESAELEAVFEIPLDGPAARIMAESDLDPADGLIIRRIVARNNRHRIYINHHPATIKLLTELTDNLASISGQHAHQKLMDEGAHLDILDQFGDLTPLRQRVAALFRAMAPRIQTLGRLRGQERRQGEQLELLRFQREEIEAAGIQPDEDALLERELARLKNGEALYQAAYQAVESLYDGSDAVVDRVTAVQKSLEKAAQLDPDLSAPAAGIEDVALRIEDAAERLRQYLARIQIDPGRMDAIGERMTLLNRLKRKYGGSLSQIREALTAISGELAELENIRERIAETEAALTAERDALAAAAHELSAARREAGARLSRLVEQELAQLKMADTRFEAWVRPIPAEADRSPYLADGGNALAETGMDRVTFRIAPNVGEDLKPLAAIASGGELSRLVLALKAMLAQSECVETVVFDEVDAGIGGDVADIVGRKIAALAARHQVVCITHLPQIARHGAHHFRIVKQVENQRTITRITPLDQPARVQEIARMLGGEKMTQATLNHAREMVEGGGV